MKEALVVIDMQNDFTYGALKNEMAIAIIPRVKEVIEEALSNNIDLFFTMDVHFDNYLTTREGIDLPIKHCIENTNGYQIVDELKTYEKYAKAICGKPSFGATDLIKYLKDYDKITYVGTCTDICVVSNVLLTKSFYPESEFVVIENACAGTTIENHNAAIKTMANCFVKVV